MAGQPTGSTPRPAHMRVAIVAANTFQYDARQLRSADALTSDGHTVTLIGFAGDGLPTHERLAGGIELRRIAIDRSIASAFRPLPPAGRRLIVRLLGIDPGATSLPAIRPVGWIGCAPRSAGSPRSQPTRGGSARGVRQWSRPCLTPTYSPARPSSRSRSSAKRHAAPVAGSSTTSPISTRKPRGSPGCRAGSALSSAVGSDAGCGRQPG